MPPLKRIARRDTTPRASGVRRDRSTMDMRRPRGIFLSPIHMSTPHIRLALESDLPAINAIYNHYVAHSTCTYQLAPETDEARLAWFQRHDAAHPITVAEESGEIVGWGSLNVFHPREAYARTVENSVYLRHDQRGRGLGRALLADLIARARALGHHTIIAGVSAEQTASLRLHIAFGFAQIGRLREVGFKHGQWLDVISLQLMLGKL